MKVTDYFSFDKVSSFAEKLMGRLGRRDVQELPPDENAFEDNPLYKKKDPLIEAPKFRALPATPQVYGPKDKEDVQRAGVLKEIGETARDFSAQYETMLEQYRTVLQDPNLTEEDRHVLQEFLLVAEHKAPGIKAFEEGVRQICEREGDTKERAEILAQFVTAYFDQGLGKDYALYSFHQGAVMNNPRITQAYTRTFQSSLEPSIKYVQRLPRYPLLISELLKTMPSSRPVTTANMTVKEVIAREDQRLKKLEKQQVLLQKNSLILACKPTGKLRYNPQKGMFVSVERGSRLSMQMGEMAGVVGTSHESLEAFTALKNLYKKAVEVDLAPEDCYQLVTAFDTLQKNSWFQQFDQSGMQPNVEKLRARYVASLENSCQQAKALTAEVNHDAVEEQVKELEEVVRGLKWHRKLTVTKSGQFTTDERSWKGGKGLFDLFHITHYAGRSGSTAPHALTTLNIKIAEAQKQADKGQLVRLRLIEEKVLNSLWYQQMMENASEMGWKDLSEQDRELRSLTRQNAVRGRLNAGELDHLETVNTQKVHAIFQRLKNEGLIS